MPIAAVFRAVARQSCIRLLCVLSRQLRRRLAGLPAIPTPVLRIPSLGIQLSLELARETPIRASAWASRRRIPAAGRAAPAWHSALGSGHLDSGARLIVTLGSARQRRHCHRRRCTGRGRCGFTRQPLKGLNLVVQAEPRRTGPFGPAAPAGHGMLAEPQCTPGWQPQGGGQTAPPARRAADEPTPCHVPPPPPLLLLGLAQGVSIRALRVVDAARLGPWPPAAFSKLCNCLKDAPPNLIDVRLSLRPGHTHTSELLVQSSALRGGGTAFKLNELCVENLGNNFLLRATRSNMSAGGADQSAMRQIARLWV